MPLAYLAKLCQIRSGYFKEHRVVQDLIEDKVFYLYRPDFCAAATEALVGAVMATVSGGLAGGVFSQRPSALLLLTGSGPKGAAAGL